MPSISTSRKLLPILAVHTALVAVPSTIVFLLGFNAFEDVWDVIYFGAVNGQIALLAMWSVMGVGFWLLRHLHCLIWLITLWCLLALQFAQAAETFGPILIQLMAIAEMVIFVVVALAWWLVRARQQRTLSFGRTPLTSRTFSLAQLMALTSAVAILVVTVPKLVPASALAFRDLSLVWTYDLHFELTAQFALGGLATAILAVPATVAILSPASNGRRVAAIAAATLVIAAGLQLLSNFELWRNPTVGGLGLDSARVLGGSAVTSGTVIATVVWLQRRGLGWTRQET